MTTNKAAAVVSEEMVRQALFYCPHELSTPAKHRWIANEINREVQAALGVGGWRPMDAAWFQGIPQEPGIYRVTGWCLDDLTQIAVVQVDWDASHLELVHNLHRETSCEPEEFRPFRNMSREFWWQRVDLVPLPPPPASEEG